MYRIREGKKADFPEVARLYNDPVHARILIEQGELVQVDYESYISSERNKIYIVEKSGKMAGFILFHITKDTVFIDSLTIHKAYVRKGVAEHLYHKMNQFAGRRNLKQLQTKITTADPIIRKFFSEKDWMPAEEEDIFFRSL